MLPRRRSEQQRGFVLAAGIIWYFHLACENIRFSSLFSPLGTFRAEELQRARNVPSGEERWETDVFAG